MILVLNDVKKVVLDTSYIMNNYEDLSELFNFYDVIINIVTLKELDKLKNDRDANRAFMARESIKAIYKYSKLFTYDLDSSICEELKNDNLIYTNNDDIIISCAIRNDAAVITEDIGFIVKSKALNLNVLNIEKNKDKYTGFVQIKMCDEQIAEFYSNLDKNIYDLLTNEYIFIYDKDGYCIDTRKWDGESFVEIYSKGIKTQFFGDKLSAKDEFQRAVIDSIITNPITVVSGIMGTGKSLLSLAASFKLIETGKFDRIIVMFNPSKARGASEMGYYSGDTVEKALQNNIGNMLSTKLANKEQLMQFIEDDRIRLVSMADCRGMEVREGEIMYITEAQNTTADLIKLCISRSAVGSKIIVDGDFNSQVDSIIFEGKNNGMRRVINHLKGKPYFGFVELQNVYRSEWAEDISKI